MPTFLCRWENGDISFVSARDKDTAIILLDEVANAEGMPITAGSFRAVAACENLGGQAAEYQV